MQSRTLVSGSTLNDLFHGRLPLLSSYLLPAPNDSPQSTGGSLEGRVLRGRGDTTSEGVGNSLSLSL